MTLYALCKPKGELLVKRILLSPDAQKNVANYFNQQHAAFMDGVDFEVQFDGDWKPDADEILTIGAPDEAKQVRDIASKNAVAIAAIDAGQLDQEQIKALFVRQPNGRLLFQSFSTKQLLMRSHAFLLSNDTFKELETPAFTIANNISAVLEGDFLKFKSLPAVKRFLDMSLLYQEATDAQIEAFCAHPSLSVADVEAIKVVAGPELRRRLHAVGETGVLDSYSVKQLENRAKKLKIKLPVADNKIEVPSDKMELKRLLSFLEEKVYQGALTQKLYVANAKRLYEK